MQTQWHYQQPGYRRPPGYYGGRPFGYGGSAFLGGLGGSLIAAPFLYGGYGYGYGYPPYGYGPGPYGYPPYGYYY